MPIEPNNWPRTMAAMAIDQKSMVRAARARIEVAQGRVLAARGVLSNAHEELQHCKSRESAVAAVRRTVVAERELEHAVDDLEVATELLSETRHVAPSGVSGEGASSLLVHLKRQRGAKGHGV